MKINQKLFLLILTSILAFYLVHEVKSYFTDLDNIKNEWYSKNAMVFKTVNQMQLDSLKSISLMLANDSEVKRGYLENNPQLIINHLVPFWEKAKSENLVYEIHFFKPPAQSFVNFSNFRSIGKDVSDARKDIVWVTSSFKSSTHTMMCKTYAGLRATYPIIDDGKILGGLSIGKKIDWLPKITKEISKSDAFLIYDKSSTKTLDKKFYDDFIKDKKIIGDFILGDSTIPVSQEIINEIDFTKNIQDLNINGKLYSLNLFKMDNFNNGGLGYLCILNDLNQFYSL